MADWMITSSALMIIIILIRYLFRGKIRLCIQYGLWLVVLVRLLLPVSIAESSISIMNAVSGMGDKQLLMENKRHFDEIAIDHLAGNRITAMQNANQPVNDVFKDYVFKAYALKDSDLTDLINGDIQGTQPGSAKPELSADGSELLYGIWILGMVLTAMVVTVTNWRYMRKLKCTRQSYTYEGSRLPVYFSEAVDTPCMFGILQPAIYMTSDAAADNRRLKYVITHENTHYAHWDHIWSALRAVCICLHWYNPLVWLAARLSKRDAELACDEGTILRLGEQERFNYGKALIELSIDKMSVMDSFRLSTTISGGKGQLIERIKLLVKKPKMLTATLIVVLAVCIVATACTYTGAKTKDGNTDMPQNMADDSRDDVTYGKTQEVDPVPEPEETGNGMQDTNIQKQVFGYFSYSGYLDECLVWIDYEKFVDCDYDGDGLIDRVYREENEESDYCSYRIEFGNGDILQTGEGTWSTGAPMVRAVDLTGDGQNEIIFTLSYEFSTNPMAFGDLAVWRKEEDSYKLMDLPFSQGDEPFSQCVTLSYESVGEQSLRVTCGEADLDEVVQIETELWYDYGYAEYVGKTYEHPVWNVTVDTSIPDQPKLICKTGVYDKWSADEIAAVVGYSEGALEIEDIYYLNRYVLHYPISLNRGKEYSIQLYGETKFGSDIYRITNMELYRIHGDAGEGIQVFNYPMEAAKAFWGSDDAPEPESRSKDGGLVIKDLNFDGFEDICLQAWLTDDGSIPYYCWLWNEELQELEYSYCLENGEVKESPSPV